MSRTLSINTILGGAKKIINKPIINKFLTNPILLSILIVIFIILILSYFSVIKNKNNNLFKGIVFSILSTIILIFYYTDFISDLHKKQSKQDMTDYFTGMAENSKSNIYGANRNSSEYFGGIDNLDVEKFFEE